MFGAKFRWIRIDFGFCYAEKRTVRCCFYTVIFPAGLCFDAVRTVKKKPHHTQGAKEGCTHDWNEDELQEVHLINCRLTGYNWRWILFPLVFFFSPASLSCVVRWKGWKRCADVFFFHLASALNCSCLVSDGISSIFAGSCVEGECNCEFGCVVFFPSSRG